MSTIPATIQTHHFESTESPALTAGEIHLWQSQLDEATPAREMAALSRRILLDLLRHYSGEKISPTIRYGEHGKPHVEEAHFPYFNLSHSGHCIVLAFSRDNELGVDVECTAARRRRSPLELARRFFAAKESNALGLLDENAAGVAFTHLWTVKEAVLKALGHGLSFGLDRLQFALGEDGVPLSLESIAVEAGAPEEWQIHRFAPTLDHVGCLAWRGPPRPIRTFLLQVPEAQD